MRPIGQSALWLTTTAAFAALLSSARAAHAQAPPDPLTMQWAVDAALSSHPAVRAADERVRAAQAGPGQAWVVPDPMLMIQGFPAYRFGEGPEMVMFELRQDIPLGSQRRLTAGAAAREVGAARADARTTSLDLALAARLAFIRLAEAEETRSRREQELELARATAEVVRARVTTGASPPSSVLDAMFLVTEGEAALEAARGDEAGARAALAVLVGLPAGTPLPHAQPLALPPEPPPLAELVARALQARPELRALVARQQAATLRGDAARARSAPSLTLGAGYMLDFMARDGLMATVGMSLPLWGGARSAEARGETRAAAALSADEASLARTIVADIAATRAALVAMRGRATIVRERLVPQAHTHHELALGEFARGQTDLFGVLEALRHHITSRLEEVMTNAQASRLQAALDRATASLPATNARQGEE